MVPSGNEKNQLGNTTFYHAILFSFTDKGAKKDYEVSARDRRGGHVCALQLLSNQSSSTCSVSEAKAKSNAFAKHFLSPTWPEHPLWTHQCQSKGCFHFTLLGYNFRG